MVYHLSYMDCLSLRILLDNLLLVQDYRLYIMTYLSNRKNWKVELDEIVVTAKRPHSSSPPPQVCQSGLTIRG